MLREGRGLGLGALPACTPHPEGAWTWGAGALGTPAPQHRALAALARAAHHPHELPCLPVSWLPTLAYD